jgi:hypothetical protein
LSPEQLVAAVCQDPDKDKPDHKVDFDINFVFGAYQNLLVVDEAQNVCRFSHLSVREYFERNHWDADQANVLVVKVCLVMLNHRDHWVSCLRVAAFGDIYSTLSKEITQACSFETDRQVVRDHPLANPIKLSSSHN